MGKEFILLILLTRLDLNEVVLDTDSTTITKNRRMRIGIVSLYGWLKLWDNYGTLLQNFALQTFLQQRGHDTFWIRTRTTPPVRSRWQQFYHENLSRLRATIRLLMTPFLGISRSKRLTDFNQRNPRHFNEFMARHVPTTPQEFTITELIDQPPVMDTLVVGSDQIWRDVTKLNFLDFGPQDIRRIAYAVSAPWPVLDEDWIHSAMQYTAQLNAVSVREIEGLTICKKLQITNAVHVVDPVLLLDSSDYLEIIRQDGEDRHFTAQFVLGYFVNINMIDQLPWEQIVSFTSERGDNLRIIPVQGAELVIPEKYIFTPSPSAWMNAFHKANCVVTNSYHGALFAIIMKKSFLVFLQRGGSHENGRFTSALRRLGLDDRMLTPDVWSSLTPDTLDSLMSQPIDWDDVTLKLSEWRKLSAGFLDMALEN